MISEEPDLIFGHESPRTSFEYLPKNSTTWKMGESIIPGEFKNGCAIAVNSDQEIWLLGGEHTENRILSFDVVSHSFRELESKLIIGRYGARCAFIPGTKKILVTGGRFDNFDYNVYSEMEDLQYTEIIDTTDGRVTLASPMNFPRYLHGMGVITTNGQDQLSVFGGSYDDIDCNSVELYNAQTCLWETTNITLSSCKSMFGFLSVKLGNIMSLK